MNPGTRHRAGHANAADYTRTVSRAQEGAHGKLGAETTIPRPFVRDARAAVSRRFAGRSRGGACSAVWRAVATRRANANAAASSSSAPCGRSRMTTDGATPACRTKNGNQELLTGLALDRTVEKVWMRDRALPSTRDGGRRRRGPRASGGAGAGARRLDAAIARDGNRDFARRCEKKRTPRGDRAASVLRAGAVPT